MTPEEIDAETFRTMATMMLVEEMNLLDFGLRVALTDEQRTTFQAIVESLNERNNTTLFSYFGRGKR